MPASVCISATPVCFLFRLESPSAPSFLQQCMASERPEFADFPVLSLRQEVVITFAGPVQFLGKVRVAVEDGELQELTDKFCDASLARMTPAPAGPPPPSPARRRPAKKKPSQRSGRPLPCQSLVQRYT